MPGLCGRASRQLIYQPQSVKCHLIISILKHLKYTIVIKYLPTHGIKYYSLVHDRALTGMIRES